MFDPKATGTQGSPQFADGGTSGEGGAGTGTPAGAGGRVSQAGSGNVGTGAVSGGAAGASGAGAGAGTGASGSGGAGIGGMSGGMAGGPPPPPPLANGEACTEDTRCMSGHCDGICCDKGSECCKTVDDCTTQPGGLGMSCDDRSQCRGSAGKISCTSEFKCVTVNGQRDDRACTNRVEANDCGYYTSVFCLGGELQNGAPACKESCASDTDCDAEAHCNDGECVPDLSNGEPCTRQEDCVTGICRNIQNGVGICCGLLGDCCKTADDCPATYRREATCTNLQECRGTRTNAVCNFNICGSESMPANEACNGMIANECGFFQDVVCMAGRNNSCRQSCSNVGHCDPEGAFCDNGVCVAERPNGQACTSANQCQSGNCTNNVCCAVGGECCANPSQCTRGLDARCDLSPEFCQGTIARATCASSICQYDRNERVDDDRACNGAGNTCGFSRDIMCNGMSNQNAQCRTMCMNQMDCDQGSPCRNGLCVAPGSGESGAPGGGGSGGTGGTGGGGGAPPPEDDDEEEPGGGGP